MHHLEESCHSWKQVVGVGIFEYLRWVTKIKFRETRCVFQYSVNSSKFNITYFIKKMWILLCSCVQEWRQCFPPIEICVPKFERNTNEEKQMNTAQFLRRSPALSVYFLQKNQEILRRKVCNFKNKYNMKIAGNLQNLQNLQNLTHFYSVISKPGLAIRPKAFWNKSPKCIQKTWANNDDGNINYEKVNVPMICYC